MLRWWVGGMLWASALRGGLLAFAGLPVSLPAGESPADWRGPLEVANLELAIHDQDVRVRITSVGEDWVLVAVGTDREVVVSAPTTEAERTEVAVLARALGRSIEPLATPDGTLSLPIPTPPIATDPPPSPPAAGSPPRRPSRPAPAVVAAPPLVEAAVAVVVEAVADVAASGAGTLGATCASFVPAPRPPTPPPPVAAVTGPSVASPALALALGAAVRGDTAPAFTVAVRVDPVVAGRVALGFEVGARPNRGEWTSPGGAWRGFWDVSAAAGPRVRFGRGAWIDGLVGMAYRTFTQELDPVAARAIPTLGAGGGVSFGGRLRSGVQVRALYEPANLVLIDALGLATRVPRAELAIAWIVELGPIGDPFPVVPTRMGR